MTAHDDHEHEAGANHPSIGSIDRRTVLKSTAAIVGASAFAGALPHTAEAAPVAQTNAVVPRKGHVGFVLSHEQFSVRDLLNYGRSAERAGFDTLWTSDHYQPWMTNQGHVGQAWVTLGALGQRTTRIPIGTGVTCPTFKYNPAIVAEAFSTLGFLYPGRVFLGLGSGEALNEQTATGVFPPWQERWDRLLEAVQIIRQLWSGQTVNFEGKFYTVQFSRLYDLPPVPVPIYLASNGVKSMFLAAQYGDGVITDPTSWMNPDIRAQFDAGARAAGKNPASVPVLLEAFVVVGTQRDAEEAAAYWRFLPDAWKTLYREPDPERILHRAEIEIPLEEVYKDWPISTDPNVHVQALQKLFDMGATQVFVHSGQLDQQRVINFYAQSVLPRWKRLRQQLYG